MPPVTRAIIPWSDHLLSLFPISASTIYLRQSITNVCYKPIRPKMVKTFVPPGETNKLGIMVSACNIKIYCENVEMSILGINAFCFIRESSLSIIIQLSCFLFLFQLLALIRLFVVLWLLCCSLSSILMLCIVEWVCSRVYELFMFI